MLHFNTLDIHSALHKSDTGIRALTLAPYMYNLLLIYINLVFLAMPMDPKPLSQACTH